MNNKIFEWAGVVTAILYSLFVAMNIGIEFFGCLLYTSPSPRDRLKSRMPSSA